METTTNLLLFLCLLGDFNCADDLIERGLYLSIIIYKTMCLIIYFYVLLRSFQSGNRLAKREPFQSDGIRFRFPHRDFIKVVHVAPFLLLYQISLVDELLHLIPIGGIRHPYLRMYRLF